jgi:hypothetical protein
MNGEQRAPTGRTEPRQAAEARPSSAGRLPELPRVSPRPSQPAQRAIELHIDELVLHGFAHGDRHRIAEGLERELTRLLTERGVPLTAAHNAEIANMDAGKFETHADSNADDIGARVARAVFGGLGG